eukprot:CAMPEP_0119119854 /NCGR_PEP_ID=MMETSP1310-20130426/1161_1 /TAXON_ID=464262 /ORGANISM="Genus nov. species nov., Strain RCC2339" /LENGTH=200 /DNA_ID=CAMNT_0007109309 /DNA_START=182 /DNA_END=781 /DNA_ORIENTATION=-
MEGGEDLPVGKRVEEAGDRKKRTMQDSAQMSTMKRNSSMASPKKSKADILRETHKRRSYCTTPSELSQSTESSSLRLSIGGIAGEKARSGLGKDFATEERVEDVLARSPRADEQSKSPRSKSPKGKEAKVKEKEKGASYGLLSPRWGRGENKDKEKEKEKEKEKGKRSKSKLSKAEATQSSTMIIKTSRKTRAEIMEMID